MAVNGLAMSGLELLREKCRACDQVGDPVRDYEIKYRHLPSLAMERRKELDVLTKNGYFQAPYQQ